LRRLGCGARGPLRLIESPNLGPGALPVPFGFSRIHPHQDRFGGKVGEQRAAAPVPGGTSSGSGWREADVDRKDSELVQRARRELREHVKAADGLDLVTPELYAGGLWRAEPE